MSFRSIHVITLIAVVLFFVSMGCSGNGSPVVPENSFTKPADSKISNNTHLWGSWDIILDPSTASAEIVPVRGAAFTANVTQFLQPPIAANHRMSIELSPDCDWLTGYVKVDVIFTHPFPGLDMYTGFDVRGVCIGDGSISGVFDTDILYAGPDDLHVLNPDGLTRWYNPDEFSSYETILGFTLGKLGTPDYDWTATLSGYKYYCDGLESDTDVTAFFTDPSCTNPRGLFSAGTANRRTYELQFGFDGSMPSYKFQYAVVASWENPDEDPVDVPDSFPMTANCHEAYAISTSDLSDMYFVDGGGSGGSLKMLVRIFDHQGAMSTGVSDEISAIHLETDSGLISSKIASFDTVALADALVGKDSISATYELEVMSVSPYESGEFPVMVIIENADPSTYDPGFPGFVFPDGNLSAYFTTLVAVDGIGPISVDSIDPDNGDLNEVLTGVEVSGLNFLATASVKLVKNDDPGVEVEATNEIMSGGGTLITCDLDLDESAGTLTGIYHVVVENSVTSSGQLDDGFTVNEPYEYWWKNIMYESYRGGYNPTATTPDPEDLTLKYSVAAPQAYKYGTPVVAGDKIFYTSHTSFYANSNVRVYAHDLETGTMLWNAQIDPSGTYERYMPSLAFYKGPDGVERVLAGGDRLYCFDAESSGTNPTPLWTYDDSDPTNQNWLGTVFVVYEDKLIARGREYPIMYILDVTDGSVLHRISPINTSYESGVSAFEGKIYSNGSVNVECIDIETGDIDWTTVVPSGLGVSHYGPPCVADGRIYFGSYQGYVQCYAIEDDGTYVPGDFIWSVRVPSGRPINGGVAKLGDRLFCATALSGGVYCVIDEGDTGSVDWSLENGYYDACMTVTTTPSYPDGVVIAPHYATTNVHFIDATDGSIIRSINEGQSHRAGAAIVGSEVIVAGAYNLRVYE